jgi:Protein of unknown function, DUF481
MKEFGILVFTVCCSVYFADAQLNESDTFRFQVRTTLTGNFQKGNVKVTTIRSKLDIAFAPNSLWVFKTQNNSLYQSFAAKADNDLFSRNYIYYKPKKKIYPYAIAYISTNFRRKIDSRYFAGAGATWQIINQEKHILKLSANAVFERTNFNGNSYNFPEFNGKDESSVWRGTFFLSGFHTFLEKHIRLYYDAFWQPAFENSKDYRFEYEIGMDFPVWKSLSFNCLYNYKHENVVVQKIKQDDIILTFGLAYNLKRK